MTRRAFTLALTGSAAALAADTPKEHGRQLIDKVMGGLGGDAFRTLGNVVQTGRAFSFYRDKLKGLSVATIYTSYLQPDASGGQHGLLQMQRESYGKNKEDTILFTRNEAYEVTFRGARPLGEDRFKQYRESTLLDIFYILRQRLDEPGVEFEAAGSDVIENQSVQIINVYDSEDRKVTVWVNAFTFLPIKQHYQRWDATINDRHDEVTYYAKYHDAGGGVMWPYDIQRERDGSKIFQMYSDTVTVNAALGSNLFELPNGIKILKT